MSANIHVKHCIEGSEKASTAWCHPEWSGLLTSLPPSSRVSSRDTQLSRLAPEPTPPVPPAAMLPPPPPPPLLPSLKVSLPGLSWLARYCCMNGLLEWSLPHLTLSAGVVFERDEDGCLATLVVIAPTSLGLCVPSTTSNAQRK